MGGEGTKLMFRKRRGDTSGGGHNSGLELHGRRLNIVDRKIKKKHVSEWKWAATLIDVGETLKDMPVSPHVRILYNVVIPYLDKAVDNFTSYDITNDGDWKEMYRFLGNTVGYFESVKYGLSVNIGEDSLYHLFDALVSSLKVEKMNWYKQKLAKRQEFLLLWLEEMGDKLYALDKDGYYDKALGRGCAKKMQSVYELLRNESNDDYQRRGRVSGGKPVDWRDRLQGVMEVVDTLESSPSTQWIFNMVKNFMLDAVNKMRQLDLSKNGHWAKVIIRLNRSIGVYFVASGITGGVGKVFKKLHGALESQLKKVDWNEIHGLDARNAKIDSIMKALGRALREIETEDYNSFLVGDGASKMETITAILLDESS